MQANRGYYTSNEALVEQYAEMDATHGALIAPCGAAVCGNAAECPNAAVCGNAANCGNPACSKADCDPATCVPAEGCCAGAVVAVEETETESAN